ncbi:FAD-dependent thymidylate synthase [Neiella sp. HB171785]|uniref:Flavin-dependent thymidylate synthase n=1 Tax=Neiella litorisoli TaxID=2771431 RepID=A0A8J6QGX5_9GAMM|nr:FAD-dependent thymidylate synthase [Neiella litorisoli]MBD1389300.1 FAD-dependent thymidylate synthase [Neiella litorisoli]
MIEISELSIKCLARPNFDEDSFLSFLDEQRLNWNRSSCTPGEELIEAAGRVCYMAFGAERQSGKDNRQYIKHLVDQGHESVLEHVNWTFLISGVSRAFTHQLVRHRVGFAYSQLSQQYHDESGASFVVPPEIARCPNLFNEWKKTIEQSLAFYKRLVYEINNDPLLCESSKKEKLRGLRSASRSILPNATETKIVVTANARALRHFFKMRGALEGDWEMRKISCALFDIVTKDVPAAFQDFKPEKMKDGSFKLVQL